MKPARCAPEERAARDGRKAGAKQRRHASAWSACSNDASRDHERDAEAERRPGRGRVRWFRCVRRAARSPRRPRRSALDGASATTAPLRSARARNRGDGSGAAPGGVGAVWSPRTGWTDDVATRAPPDAPPAAARRLRGAPLPRRLLRAPFAFETDTFGFANELLWSYGYDADGTWRSTERMPEPEYVAPLLRARALGAPVLPARALRAGARPALPETELRERVRAVVGDEPARAGSARMNGSSSPATRTCVRSRARTSRSSRSRSAARSGATSSAATGAW